jgi:hypothetical protein
VFKFSRKEAARKRGVDSPDRAEALLLALPAATWSAATAIRLVPAMGSQRFDNFDPRHQAAAQLASGRWLGKQEREDLIADAQPRARTSRYVRRVKQGIFQRGF